MTFVISLTGLLALLLVLLYLVPVAIVWVQCFNDARSRKRGYMWGGSRWGYDGLLVLVWPILILIKPVKKILGKGK